MKSSCDAETRRRKKPYSLLDRLYALPKYLNKPRSKDGFRSRGNGRSLPKKSRVGPL